LGGRGGGPWAACKAWNSSNSYKSHKTQKHIQGGMYWKARSQQVENQGQTFRAGGLPWLLVVVPSKLPHGALLQSGLILVHCGVFGRLKPTGGPICVPPLALLYRRTITYPAGWYGMKGPMCSSSGAPVQTNDHISCWVVWGEGSNLCSSSRDLVHTNGYMSC